VEGGEVGALVVDDGVPVADEESTCRREIAFVNISEGVVEEFIWVVGTRRSRNLEDEGRTLAGGATEERSHRHTAWR